MYKGPFTYDDQFIVSPFRDIFLYIPGVTYALAKNLTELLNNAGASRKRNVGVVSIEHDVCVDPLPVHYSELEGEENRERQFRISRRQVVDLTAGYTTKDDFGTDGDDTAHSEIPYHEIPDFFQGVAGFNDSQPVDVVDVVFVDL
ncbi:hypothetical protein PC116_g30194 [Phytophthora cactorum]|nr:hypothetical protein PC116_g30194 [Phytophthora cactorum]